MAEFNIKNGLIGGYRAVKSNDLVGKFIPDLIEGKGFVIQRGKKLALKKNKRIGTKLNGYDADGYEIYPEDLQQQTLDNDSPLKLSYLGTPVYSNLIFPNGNYQDPDQPADANARLAYDGLSIDTVIFKVSQTRNIVENKVNGFNGTIKEFINDGDYLIEATGVIIGESLVQSSSDEADPNRVNDNIASIGARYPYNDIERLKTIASVPDSIPIVSDFLGIFDINDVVLKRIDVNQVEGAKNYAEFKIIMVSDNADFVLEV